MRISKIELKNWCQYEGNHVLDIGATPDRNVVLIHADNDVGKSSLFAGMRWCLFGDKTAKWIEKDWPLYPITWYERAKDGDELTTEVAITFQHERLRYCATRWFSTVKTRHEPLECNKGFQLQKADLRGNWTEDHESTLYRIFPRSTLGYFVFDAETIEHFANDRDGVKESVLRLLNIGDAERALVHLDEVNSALQREFKKKKNNRVDELTAASVRIKALLETLRNELANPGNGYEARLKQMKEEIKDVDSELFKFKPIHDLLNEEKRIESGIHTEEESADALTKELKEETQHLYAVLALPILKNAKKFLDEKRKKGELPKHIKRSFVDERIKLGLCICGSSLTEGSEHYRNVRAFADTLSDEVSEHATRLTADIRGVLGRVEVMGTPLGRLIRRETEVEEALKKLDEERKDVRSKIQARSDIPDVPALETRRENLRNSESELFRKIYQNEAKIGANEGELSHIDNALKDEIRKGQEGSEVEAQWIVANQAFHALSNALASFKKRARAYLEKQCNILGKELFWRDEVYTIHISEEYVVKVTNPMYGTHDLLGGMSMGATQMTGLAIICALAKQTRARVPLIMDTPFARLSPGHITRALTQCPEHFEQWILFVQPSEWNDREYRPFLAGRLQNEFTLERQGKSEFHVTRSHIGYHPEFFAKVTR